MKNKTIIIIVGPTAVGKTSLAIQLAEYLRTKIISADSRQCFKEINIGVAKPSDEELKKVHHYFINTFSINEEVNAALFEKLALQYAQEIFKENDFGVMVGGTGLYVKAFCEGLDEMPAANLLIRNEIQNQFIEKGLAWLQNELQKNDPEFYNKGEIQNPHRMMRALEIKLTTGKSILTFRSQQKKERPFNIIKIGLQLNKELLHQNINKRVAKMMDDGLLNEVKNLFPYKNLNALNTVGYTELFNFLEEKVTLAEAVDLIKKNTRHYAKRQMTWFKKDADIKWFSPNDFELVKNFVLINN